MCYNEIALWWKTLESQEKVKNHMKKHTKHITFHWVIGTQTIKISVNDKCIYVVVTKYL